MGKHVIILGAGASKSSGYPLANDLRLLMMSPNRVFETVAAQIPEAAPDRAFLLRDIRQALDPMFRGKGESVNHLFRDGGFASIDEFSNLAHKQFPEEIQDLKRRLRFALALHNPEEKFVESDYYPFLQKLFKGGIFPLRDDISILTFNFDPYLPFLLRRAIHVRYKAAGQERLAPGFDDAATSGFSAHDLNKFENDTGLCLLHLHGLIASPDREDEPVSFDDLFCRATLERFRSLHSSHIPPVIFPWELMDQSGRFCPKEKFCFSARRSEYDLFCAIWRRAQKEITSATKISFVGLSMHEFLNPAFEFLFKTRNLGVSLVVANPELDKFKDRREKLVHHRSPAFKVRELLSTVCGTEQFRQSVGGCEFATCGTFAEFIANHMS